MLIPKKSLGQNYLLDRNIAKKIIYSIDILNQTIIEIGPESENFFILKPFAGMELTSDSAMYFIGGI